MTNTTEHTEADEQLSELIYQANREISKANDLRVLQAIFKIPELRGQALAFLKQSLGISEKNSDTHILDQVFQKAPQETPSYSMSETGRTIERLLKLIKSLTPVRS